MTKLLFLGKAEDYHTAKALSFCQQHFKTTACLGKWGDSLPDSAKHWKGRYIISYLSRWVVPDSLLSKATSAAINFHTGSPEYPGIGCNNFALYHGTDLYGVTCHHMASKVDTGSIIAVKWFPMYPQDDVDSLLTRTYDYQLVLFYEIMNLIIKEIPLPVSAEYWHRKPYTRQEFNELFKLSHSMSANEIARRTRAVTYKHWRPYYID